MRILLVGAGGVGSAAVAIAARRSPVCAYGEARRRAVRGGLLVGAGRSARALRHRRRTRSLRHLRPLVRCVEVSPRDLVAAVLPDPATLGEKMRGKTCAGTYVTGTGPDRRQRR